MNWEYMQPVEIHFGSGSRMEIGRIAKERGYHKGLLVCGRHFAACGAEELMAASEGLLTDIFSDVSPNPEVSEVNLCAAKARECGADFIAAVGGGSILDCAKAASGMAVIGDPVEKYLGTGVPVPQDHLPLIAVPTTSGTGSEVTCVSVLSDSATGRKAPIVSDSFYPVLALVDPELTWSMPKSVTASSGIDALCHAIECYWSRRHQPISDALALHACRLIFDYLPAACADGADKEAREKMSEAALIAGLAFNLPKTTGCHACSYPLTNEYHIPHGEACALTLDYFCRLNRNERLDTFSRQLGFRDADDLADAIAALKKEIGLRTDLKEFHPTEEQLRALAKASQHPNMRNNPVDMSDEDLYKMYRFLSR